MAYQDVKRAKTAIVLSPKADPNVKFGVLLQEHQQLAQEVVECHNRVAVFTQTMTGAGITSFSVSLPFTMRDANYAVCAMFAVSQGGWWVTGRTTKGFLLNWVTALTNAVVTFLIVN